MAGPEQDAILEAWLGRHERLAVLAACLLAGARVLVFGAAFPFFSNTDEQAHFDVVHKYTFEGVPEGLDRFSPASSRLIVLHESPEYVMAGGPPPLWLIADPATRSQEEDAVFSLRVSRRNSEATQPPVYYAAAAAWYRLGRAVGVSGGRELYWIRLLNVLVFVILVWASFGWAKAFFPAPGYFRLGAPILLAALPQSIIFTINSDVLSPLLFGVAFFGLARIWRLPAPPVWLCAATGLAAAAAFLTKYSNVPILVLLALGVVVAALRGRRSGQRWIPGIAALALASCVPIALWVARNILVLGDLTGSAAKLRMLDWSPKPTGDLLHHPIFAPGGIVTFWDSLIPTYWRGEVVWHGVALAWGAADAFYSVSTALFLGAAAVRYLRPRAAGDDGARAAGRMGLLAFALAVLFLVCMSVAFDFGRCHYPSRASPYLVSGRLIWGTVAPFLFLYAAGLDTVLARLGLRHYRMVALLSIAVAMTLSEVTTSMPVFRSEYNWFHLPQDARVPGR